MRKRINISVRELVYRWIEREAAARDLPVATTAEQLLYEALPTRPDDGPLINVGNRRFMPARQYHVLPQTKGGQPEEPQDDDLEEVKRILSQKTEE